MVSERASERTFFGVSALLFAASAAVTIAWCASMAAMGEMPMPGGWTMSMAWMRMPGQTWLGAAASFLGMWVVMMVATMVPSLVPMLWRYRQAVGRTGETRLGRLTALVGLGYFFVWTDYRDLGEQLWKRFKGSRDDILWYYRELYRPFGRSAHRLSTNWIPSCRSWRSQHATRRTDAGFTDERATRPP
jgi:hypothetical protein